MDTQPGQVFPPRDNGSHPNEPPQPAPGALPSMNGVSSVAGSPQPTQTNGPVTEQISETTQPFVPSVDVDSDANDWQNSREDNASDPTPPLPDDVSWTASEFIEHPKSASWYGLLAAAGLVLAAVDYFVTRDYISTGIIVLAAAMFGVYAGHKPKQLQYYLSPQGLQIGEKMYSFHTFKAFSVADEGVSASIVFTPLGRFAPALTIYVGPEMENQVLDYLSNFLPFEKRRADAVDGLLRRIRF